MNDHLFMYVPPESASKIDLLLGFAEFGLIVGVFLGVIIAAARVGYKFAGIIALLALILYIL